MPIANADQKVIELIHTGISAEGGSNSVPVKNVYHFYRTTTVALISKAGVFTAWKAAIGDKVILALSERYTSQNAEIRCINDAEERFSTHTFTDPGAIAGESIASRDCVTLILRSDTRGAWARGRKHYGPIAEADVADDCLDASGIALWGTVKTNLLAGFTDALGNVWKPCVVSKKYSQLIVNPTELFYYPVTEILLNLNIGEMGSRKVDTVR